MERPIGRLILVILGRILLLCIVLLVIVRLSAPSVIVSQVNKQLANTLAAPASLDKVELGILRGFVGISGLQISQPQGFGEDDFMSLGALEIDIEPLSATRQPLVVEQITLNKFALHVVLANNEAGEPTLNATMLQAESKSEPAPEKEGDPAPFSLWLQALNANDLSIRFTDRTMSPHGPSVSIKFQSL